MVCAPAPVGVTFAVTVPLLVKTLITELIAEFIVVDAVAAPAAVGKPTTPASIAKAKIDFWYFFIILIFSYNLRHALRLHLWPLTKS
jgi:hypothetical protein